MAFDELPGSTTMKFMLMMHAPRGTGDYQINSLRSAHSYYRNIRLRVEIAAATHHPLAPSYPRFLNHRLRPIP
jgi:hypothetical protein